MELGALPISVFSGPQSPFLLQSSEKRTYRQENPIEHPNSSSSHWDIITSPCQLNCLLRERNKLLACGFPSAENPSSAGPSAYRVIALRLTVLQTECARITLVACAPVSADFSSFRLYCSSSRFFFLWLCQHGQWTVD